MTIFGKIGLSKRYGKAIYAISAALTLAIASLVFFNPYAIPMCVGQRSDNPVSVYSVHQEYGNILLPQSWHQQERVLFHSVCGGIHRFHIVYNPDSIFR